VSAITTWIDYGQRRCEPLWRFCWWPQLIHVWEVPQCLMPGEGVHWHCARDTCSQLRKSIFYGTSFTLLCAISGQGGNIVYTLIQMLRVRWLILTWLCAVSHGFCASQKRSVICRDTRNVLACSYDSILYNWSAPKVRNAPLRNLLSFNIMDNNRRSIFIYVYISQM